MASHAVRQALSRYRAGEISAAELLRVFKETPNASSALTAAEAAEIAILCSKAEEHRASVPNTVLLTYGAGGLLRVEHGRAPRSIRRWRQKHARELRELEEAYRRRRPSNT